MLGPFPDSKPDHIFGRAHQLIHLLPRFFPAARLCSARVWLAGCWLSSRTGGDQSACAVGEGAIWQVTPSRNLPCRGIPLVSFTGKDRNPPGEVVGNCTDEENGAVTITNAKCIRYWGTDNDKPGLGYLALNGPTSKTKLDQSGTVRIPKHALVASFDVKDASAWL